MPAKKKKAAKKKSPSTAARIKKLLGMKRKSANKPGNKHAAKQMPKN
jgi:hypothetical protein